MTAHLLEPGRRAALVVAHPGHELRVLGWVERARPLVFVMTDGSGRTSVSRVPSTRRVLDSLGARPGSVFGRVTDREMYARLLARETGWFVQLAAELAAALVEERIEYVVGDSSEGYNPSHDVCRLVIDAAVARAALRTGRQVHSFDFALVNGADRDVADAAVQVTLDDAALARKLAVARGYPEMAGEVESAIDRHGVETFRVECLRPVTPAFDAEPAQPPFYERHGAQRVAEGAYAETVRFADHVRPIAQALRTWAIAND
jgi:hypothetical protein